MTDLDSASNYFFSAKMRTDDEGIRQLAQGLSDLARALDERLSELERLIKALG